MKTDPVVGALDQALRARHRSEVLIHNNERFTPPIFLRVLVPDAPLGSGGCGWAPEPTRRTT